MRPIPWMFRLGLFAAGFAMGLTHWKADPPIHRIVIEVPGPGKDANAPRILETTKPAIPPDCPVPGLQTAANHFASAGNSDRASD